MDECAEWGFRYAKYLSRLPLDFLAKISFIPALPQNLALGALLVKPTAELARRIKLDLKDKQAKWFVAGVAEVAPSIEAGLMAPLLDAAIDEVNPSLNGLFVDPCMRVFGQRRVNEYLLSVVESDADDRKAGALNASYWASRGSGSDYSTKNLSDVWRRWNHLVLKTFISNLNVDVRRSAIPRLNLDETSYDAEYRPLVAQAIAIARSHPDDYIRSRLEHQMPYKMI